MFPVFYPVPELPEVETITSQLNRKIKGKTIKSVNVRLPKLVKYPLKKFKELVSGQRVKKVERRGKLVLIELSQGYFLVIHLKLSGQLIYRTKKENILGKHTHLVYYFTDQSKLLHNDLRQFGFVKVVPKKELAAFLKKEKLGPEPLEREFILSLFKKKLAQRKKSKIKILLMDQSFVVGIGNIYANEILFSARVLPSRTAGSLKSEEIERIYKGIKKILSLAIKKRGTSDRDYVDARGREGEYVRLLKVYGREGKPCLICKNKIKRIKMGGRSSFVCDKCQK